MTNTTSTTKTAAAVEEAKAETTRVIKAGGEKGKRILAIMKDHPEFTRAQVAEAAGATVGRVGEVVRWSRDNGTKEEKAIIAAHVKAQEKAKAEREKARAAAAKEKEAARKAAAAEKAKAKKEAEAKKATPTKQAKPSESGEKPAAKTAAAKPAAQKS